MFRYIRSACALVLGLLAVAATGATADKGLPAQGSTIAMTPTREGYEASIEVSADEAYAEVAARVADPALGDKFVVETVRSQTAPRTVKRLVVRLKGTAVRTGPHGITLLASGGATPGVVERDVWLAVPPATLEPAQLIVTRVCDGVVFDRACIGALEITSNHPQLWESSRRAWLSGIVLAQKGDTWVGDEPAGTLAATGRIADIPPGQSRRLDHPTDFRLVGEFPLGTAKGKLTVDADQFATPVAMDFEIRSRSARWVMVAGLLLGLAAGYLTRQVLKGRHELNLAQQETHALLRLIDGLLASTADDTLRAAIQTARAKATEALVASSAAEAKAKTAEAEALYRGQQEAFRTRRAESDQAFNDSLAVLRARWAVPAALASVVAQASAAVETLLPTRARNDFTQEGIALDQVISTALDATQAELTRCAAAHDEAATLVAVLLPLLDAASASAFTSLPKPPPVPLRLPPVSSPKMRSDALRAALEYVHAACASIDDQLERLQALLPVRIDAWEVQLGGAALPQPAAWKHWLADARALARQVGDTPRHSGASVAPLLEPARALLRSLGTALKAQLRQSDLAAIEALLATGAYGAAVTQVATVRGRALEDRGGDGESVALAAAGAAAPGATVIVGRSSGALPTVAYGVAAAPSYDPSTLAVMAAASQRRLQVTGGLLTAIYGVIIVAGGYFLFADKWVGTLLDMATVFFWAYASDVGADAATAAARGLKK